MNKYPAQFREFSTWVSARFLRRGRNPRGFSSGKQTRQLRILVYGLNYAPEEVGIGKFTSEMCEWLTQQGHAVSAITSPPHYPEWKLRPPYSALQYRAECIANVELVRCPLFIPSRPTAIRRLIGHLSFVASSAPVVLWGALKFKPDVVIVIAPLLLTAPFGLIAARIARARAWLHIQDLEIDSAFQLNLLSNPYLKTFAFWLESLLVKRFDRVSTISAKMRAKLIQKKSPAENTLEFRNWVDASIIRPMDRMTSYRSALKLGSDDFVVLYSGSMGQKQGLDVLLAAAKLWSKTHPRIRLVLCGAGPARYGLELSAQGFEGIKFMNLQPAERLAELLATGDVHILPQLGEMADLVLPSKLSGMLASGRPVIAMAEPDTQLALEIKGAGIIVPPSNPQAIADAVIAIAQNPTENDTLGRNARAAAEAKWNKPQILKTFETSLYALAGERR